jgi:hypothetical protein
MQSGGRELIGQGLRPLPVVDAHKSVVGKLSTPGRAFHNANSRLPLSAAACSSWFDATAISPSLTVAGSSRHSVIPSLPMM